MRPVPSSASRVSVYDSEDKSTSTRSPSVVRLLLVQFVPPSECCRNVRPGCVECVSSTGPGLCHTGGQQKTNG
eukprot:5991995-Amphidinium_carterae.1